MTFLREQHPFTPSAVNMEYSEKLPRSLTGESRVLRAQPSIRLIYLNIRGQLSCEVVQLGLLRRASFPSFLGNLGLNNQECAVKLKYFILAVEIRMSQQRQIETEQDTHKSPTERAFLARLALAIAPPSKKACSASTAQCASV